ncbi:MAG: nucleotide exchange factor GrpE [Bacteroidetes bacterium]|nr:MAG: nucleotide exchange factor GrpE [Bacteroidota bacterium]
MKHKEDAKAWTENDQNTEGNERNDDTQAEFVNDREHSLPDADTEEADPLIKMEVELSEQKDKLLRLYSEFENYKKRVSREKTEQLKYAAIDTYLTFLPVIDDFERAQKSMEEATDVESVREGVKLIYQKFKSLLESKGVKAMNAVGTAFDPELHDAISNMPAPSNDQKGMILDEIERGYLLNDKVIRHAKVIVAN